MTERIVVSGLDYSLEGTSVSGMRIADINAANFDAQIAAAEAVQDAIQGVSLIDFEGLQVTLVVADRETDRPASGFAQREAKWLVTMSDNGNGRLNQFEIGGPDLTLLGADGSTLDVSAGAGAALVTALETNLVSRDGNAMTYVKAVHVGRNN